MSPWTHSLCQECWDLLNPGREAVRVRPEFASQDVCCQCGGTHKSGIYVRRDPSLMACQGFPFSIHNKPKELVN